MVSTTGRAAPDTLAAVSASCSRPGCRQAPTATLTYNYEAGLATIDHLASPHPMQYDLCDTHAARLSVPKGWGLVDLRVRAPVVDLGDRRAS